MGKFFSTISFWGAYTNYVDTKGGGGVMEMSTFVYIGGGEVLSKVYVAFWANFF